MILAALYCKLIKKYSNSEIETHKLKINLGLITVMFFTIGKQLLKTIYLVLIQKKPFCKSAKYPRLKVNPLECSYTKKSNNTAQASQHFRTSTTRPGATLG